jgi:hypothetical protein
MGKINKQELEEIKAYVKEQAKKLKVEGSTTAGVPGYQTPAAFTGEEGGDGAETTDFEQGQFAYSIKAPKKKKHFIKLKEASYKEFKQDTNQTGRQKINSKILEVSKMLREISRALDHSIKLKEESAVDNSIYWKRTNEAILKINKRLAEVSKKARKLANINELAGSSVKERLFQYMKKANLPVKPEDIQLGQSRTEHHEFDVYFDGEPYAIDYDKGMLFFQDMDKEIPLGNFDQEQEIVQNLTKIFKP